MNASDVGLRLFVAWSFGALPGYFWIATRPISLSALSYKPSAPLQNSPCGKVYIMEASGPQGRRARAGGVSILFLSSAECSIPRSYRLTSLQIFSGRADLVHDAVTSACRNGDDFHGSLVLSSSSSSSSLWFVFLPVIVAPVSYLRRCGAQGSWGRSWPERQFE